MIGNRLPRGRSATGKPGNRAPATLATVKHASQAGDAAGAVVASSSANAAGTSISNVSATVPSGLQATIDDFESRITALEP